ncbi:hypothetical protein FNH06_39335, partial [Amycolatopsis acidiphila]
MGNSTALAGGRQGHERLAELIPLVLRGLATGAAERGVSGPAVGVAERGVSGPVIGVAERPAIGHSGRDTTPTTTPT